MSKRINKQLSIGLASAAVLAGLYLNDNVNVVRADNVDSAESKTSQMISTSQTAQENNNNPEKNDESKPVVTETHEDVAPVTKTGLGTEKNITETIQSKKDIKTTVSNVKEPAKPSVTVPTKDGGQVTESSQVSKNIETKETRISSSKTYTIPVNHKEVKVIRGYDNQSDRSLYRTTDYNQKYIDFDGTNSPRKGGLIRSRDKIVLPDGTEHYTGWISTSYDVDKDGSKIYRDQHASEKLQQQENEAINKLIPKPSFTTDDTVPFEYATTVYTQQGQKVNADDLVKNLPDGATATWSEDSKTLTVKLAESVVTKSVQDYIEREISHSEQSDPVQISTTNPTSKTTETTKVSKITIIDKNNEIKHTQDVVYTVPVDYKEVKVVRGAENTNDKQVYNSFTYTQTIVGHDGKDHNNSLESNHERDMVILPDGTKLYTKWRRVSGYNIDENGNKTCDFKLTPEEDKTQSDEAINKLIPKPSFTTDDTVPFEYATTVYTQQGQKVNANDLVKNLSEGATATLSEDGKTLTIKILKNIPLSNSKSTKTIVNTTSDVDSKFATRYVLDSSLPAGTEKVVQQGKDTVEHTTKVSTSTNYPVDISNYEVIRGDDPANASNEDVHLTFDQNDTTEFPGGINIEETVKSSLDRLKFVNVNDPTDIIYSDWITNNSYSMTKNDELIPESEFGQYNVNFANQAKNNKHQTLPDPSAYLLGKEEKGSLKAVLGTDITKRPADQVAKTLGLPEGHYEWSKDGKSLVSTVISTKKSVDKGQDEIVHYNPATPAKPKTKPEQPTSKPEQPTNVPDVPAKPETKPEQPTESKHINNVASKPQPQVQPSSSVTSQNIPTPHAVKMPKKPISKTVNKKHATASLNGEKAKVNNSASGDVRPFSIKAPKSTKTVQAASVNNDKKQLPQTGEKRDNFIAAMGVAIAVAASIWGLASLRKND